MSALEGISSTCSGRHGNCSATGKKHIVLTGKCHGVPWTKIAEPYPTKIANIIAHAIMRGIENQKLANMMARGC